MIPGLRRMADVHGERTENSHLGFGKLLKILNKPCGFLNVTWQIVNFPDFPSTHVQSFGSYRNIVKKNYKQRTDISRYASYGRRSYVLGLVALFYNIFKIIRGFYKVTLKYFVANHLCYLVVRKYGSRTYRRKYKCWAPRKYHNATDHTIVLITSRSKK